MPPLRIPTVLEDSLIFATGSLSDPGNPKNCARCLLGCVGITHRLGEGMRGFCRILEKEIRYLDTIVSFLTTQRTSQELEALMSRLLECTCPQPDPLLLQLHKVGDETIKSLGLPAQYTAANILIMMLFNTVTDVLRLSSRVKVVKGGSKKWPTCRSDVIPFGHDQTATAIGQWALILPEPLALAYLARTLTLFGGTMFTALTASATFLEQLVSCFRAVVVRLRALPKPMNYVCTFTPLQVLVDFLGYRCMVQVRT